MPEEAREAITRAGLSLRSPFAGLSSGAIADRFRRLAIKLHGAGKLQGPLLSARPAFAVRLYQATRDVYQVEKALGHATVAVTEGLSAVPGGRGTNRLGACRTLARVLPEKAEA